MTIDDQLRAAVEREREASAEVERINAALYQAEQEVKRLALLERDATAAYQRALGERKAIEEEMRTGRLYERSTAK